MQRKLGWPLQNPSTKINADNNKIDAMMEEVQSIFDNADEVLANASIEAELAVV